MFSVKIQSRFEVLKIASSCLSDSPAAADKRAILEVLEFLKGIKDEQMWN